MKSILFLDEHTGLPAALLVQGFVYEGQFHGTRIDALTRTSSAISLPYDLYLEAIESGTDEGDSAFDVCVLSSHRK